MRRQCPNGYNPRESKRKAREMVGEKLALVQWKNKSAMMNLGGFVAQMNALGGLRRNNIPVVAIEPLAINHLLGGAVFHLDVGGMRESAFQTHLGLQ